MKRGKTTKRSKKIAAAPPEDERIQFIERPNGVYWRAGTSTVENGPFA